MISILRNNFGNTDVPEILIESFGSFNTPMPENYVVMNQNFDHIY